MSGRIDFTMGFNTHRNAQKSDGENECRIYIFGNFSGESDVVLDQRKIRKIDADNFDQVMTQIKPRLAIGSGASLEFKTLDDFHPDTWLEKVAILADLRKLKKELTNPNTAQQAAAKLHAYFQTETTTETAVQQQSATESQEDTLERLMGRKPETSSDSTSSVNQFIKQMVAPHVTKDADPQHLLLLQAIDGAISQFLRALLHRQNFQNLEGLWQALVTLVNEEGSDEHSFFLVDVTQGELLAESAGNSAFAEKLLQHAQSCDGQQDIIFIGDYCFSSSEPDRDLLNFFRKLAKACKGSFLAGASHALIESETAESFKEMRADGVVLAFPRYLLRLPYGKKRDPIEAIEFEECSAVPQPDELLWGNPAFLSARVLIRTHQGQLTEDQFYVSDIPAFSFEQDGGQVLQPATETVLNETQANALLSKGIMPLVSFRQRQGIRLLVDSKIY